MLTENKLLLLAQKCVRQGWSVAPAERDKAKGGWTFRGKFAPHDLKELEVLFSTPWVKGVAVATGSSSEVLALVCSEEGEEELDKIGVVPETPTLTTKDEVIYLFKRPKDKHLVFKRSISKDLKIIADTSVILKKNDKWEEDPDLVPLAEIPDWLLPHMVIGPPVLAAPSARVLVEEKKEEQDKPKQTTSALAPIEMGELLDRKIPPLDWLIEDILTVGGIGIVSGPGKNFKTWVFLEAALKVAAGGALFGKFKTKKGRVMLIDEESGENRLHRRLKILGGDVHPQLRGEVIVSSWKNFKVDNPKHMEELKTFVLEKNIKLVLFDSLVRIHSKQENVAEEMAKVFAPFKELMAEGVSILIAHHHRKQSMFSRGGASQSLRGSSDIFNAVDSQLAVEADIIAGKLKVSQEKQRDQEELKPFEVRILKNGDQLGFEYVGEIDEPQLARELARSQILEILALSQNPLSVGEIVEAVEGAGESIVREVLKELIKEDLIEEKRGPHGKKLYSLKKPRP